MRFRHPRRSKVSTPSLSRGILEMAPTVDMGVPGGGQSRHPRTVLGLLGLRCPGLPLWVNEQSKVPGPLSTVFVNFFNKSKLTSFHEFNGGAPGQGLGLEEPGSQEGPWGLRVRVAQGFCPG